MTNYPASIRKSGYWFADGRYSGSRIRPNNVVIHTTEGTSLPSYGGGATAPTYTAVPDFKNKKLVWVAHFPDEESARALKNLLGGVQTNTLNCIQIELVGTCAPASHRAWGKTPHIYWPAAPEWALRDVAKFVAYCHKQWGIPISGPKKPWVAYPASYGQRASQRMTNAQWSNFTGWSGHQHVPENDHGDPGALRWDLIEKYAKELTNPVASPRIAKVRQLINQAIAALDEGIKESKKPRPRLRAARAALVTARAALPK